MFKTKNIIYILLILVFLSVIGYMSRHIYKQNMEYQRLSVELTIKEKTAEIQAGEQKVESESPETGTNRGIDGTIETEFRDTDIIIY